MTKSTAKDLSLLATVAEYRVLLARQIALLHGTGLRAAQKRVSSLYAKGYLAMASHDANWLRGRPESVYSVTEKAAALLQEEGTVASATPANRITGDAIVHIGHELLVNWFRIHLRELDKHIPDLSTEFHSAQTPCLPLRQNGMPTIADVVCVNDAKEWFIPDGVLSIASQKQGKRLLFFLEIDLATESLRSANSNVATISQKIRSYRAYFLARGYKRYDKVGTPHLHGFRVLFLTNTPPRRESICRFIQTNSALDFIWITDAEQLFRHGIAASIWARGGKSAPLDAILGPALACELPLPRL